MSVIRVNKSRNYTVMSNYHLRDKNLSLKAKGLLSIMLSLPDDWDYSIKGLVAICKEGQTSVETALDELKEYGYVVIEKIAPNKDNGGKFEYIYNIYEQPCDNQTIENQGVENLPIENHPLNKYNISTISNNLDNNTDIDNSNNITNKQNTEKNIEKENKKRKSNSNSETIREIVKYLNEVCGTNYKASAEDTIKHINARLKEGYTIDDFKKVIDIKHDEWKDTEWEKYLRPKTLFGTKFESYINQKKIEKKEELTAVERVRRGIK